MIIKPEIAIEIDSIPMMLAKDSLHILKLVDQRDTMGFTVIDTEGILSFLKGQTVRVYFDGSQFAFGNILSSELVYVTPSGIRYHNITASSRTYAADKRLAGQAYQKQRGDLIVYDLWQRYLEPEGITLGVIDSNLPVVEQALFPYVPVSDAITLIGELVGCWWTIDENATFHFRQRGSLSAPFGVTNDICVSESITVEHSGDKYRNQQVVLGAMSTTTPQTANRKGDGETDTFVMPYPLDREPTVKVAYGYKPSIAEWGLIEPESVGVRGLDDTSNWLWGYNEQIIAHNRNLPRLGDSDYVQIVFTGRYPIIVVNRTYSEIEERQTIEGFGTGIVEEIKKVDTSYNRAGAFHLSAQLLEMYARVSRVVKFRTWKAGLKPGQVVNIDLPRYGVESSVMLIDQVRIVTEDNILFYEVHAIEGPVNKTWTEFFAEMVKETRMIIREGVGDDQLVLLPYYFSKTWTEIEVPNIFTQVTVKDEHEPSNELYPSFDPNDRVRVLEWRNGGTVLGRKAVTEITGIENDRITSVVFMENADGLGEYIDTFAWVAGIEASEDFDTGIVIDVQAFPDAREKVAGEGWQITKYDYRWGAWVDFEFEVLSRPNTGVVSLNGHVGFEGDIMVEIQRKTGPVAFATIATVPNTPNSYTDTHDFVHGNTYDYRIRFLQEGVGISDWSNIASVTYQQEKSAEIQRKIGSGSFEQLAVVTYEPSEYTDTGPFTVGQTYTYRLRVIESGEVGAWSNEETVTYS